MEKNDRKTNNTPLFINLFLYYNTATTIFMNGFFSFMLSLATVYKLGAPVSPILLR